MRTSRRPSTTLAWPRPTTNVRRDARPSRPLPPGSGRPVEHGPYQEKWITSPNCTEAENYVSSGPFMITSWTHQAEIVLEPNPNWYGHEADPDRDPLAHRRRPGRGSGPFEAGEIDMLAANPPDVPRIMADPELGPLVKPSRPGSSTTGASTCDPGHNSDRQRALPPRPVDGGRQGNDDGDRLRWPGRHRRQPDSARHAGHQPELGLPVRRRSRQSRVRDRAHELGYSDVSEVPTLSFGFNMDAGHEIRPPTCRSSGARTSASSASLRA